MYPKCFLHQSRLAPRRRHAYRLARTAVRRDYGVMVGGGAALAVLWNLLLCHRRVDFMASGVVVWWTLLCAVGVFNACGWHRSATALRRRKATAEASLHRFQRWQL